MNSQVIREIRPLLVGQQEGHLMVCKCSATTVPKSSSDFIDWKTFGDLQSLTCSPLPICFILIVCCILSFEMLFDVFRSLICKQLFAFTWEFSEIGFCLHERWRLVLQFNFCWSLLLVVAGMNRAFVGSVRVWVSGCVCRYTTLCPT